MTAKHHGRAQLSARDRSWLVTVAHVLVPSALIIAVVGAFLLVFDGWNAIAPLQDRVRWVGLFFCTAAVLITRYAGGGGDAGRAVLYAVALFGVSMYATIVLSGRHAGPMAGRMALMLATSWVIAHSLTRRLRLEVVDVEAPRGAWPTIDRLTVDRSEQASSRSRRDLAVFGVVMLGVVVFAGRAVAGASAEIQQRALNDAFACFAALAVLMASSASFQSMRRAAEPGGRMSLRGLSSRLGIAFALVLGGWLAGHVMLGSPQVDPPAAPPTPYEPGRADESEEGGEREPEQGASEQGPSEQSTEAQQGRTAQNQARGPGQGERAEGRQQGDRSQRQGDASSGRSSRLPSNAGVVQQLASLIRTMFLTLLPVAVLVLVVVALIVILRRARAAARDDSPGSSEDRAPPADPFAGLAALRNAEPRRAVDEGWRRASAWAQQTCDLDDSATPDQLTAAVEREQPAATAPFGVLREAWLRATFAGTEPDEGDRRAVLAALDDLSRLARTGRNR